VYSQIRVVTKSVLSLCLSKNYVISKACVWVKLQIQEFLHSAPYWDECSASLSGCLEPEGNGPIYPLIGRWNQSGRLWNEINLLFLPPIQTRFLNCLFRNLVGIPTALLRLPILLLVYHFIVVKFLLLKYTFSVWVGYPIDSHLRYFYVLMREVWYHYRYSD
jgi:hypothetical protein